MNKYIFWVNYFWTFSWNVSILGKFQSAVESSVLKDYFPSFMIVLIQRDHFQKFHRISVVEVDDDDHYTQFSSKL